MAIKGADKNERVGSGRREERDGRYCWILSDRMMKHIYILNREHIKVSSYFRKYWRFYRTKVSICFIFTFFLYQNMHERQFILTESIIQKEIKPF